MTCTDERFVRELTESLTRTERHVLALRYGEELTVDEIALVLDLSAPAVESTLDAIRLRTAEALRSRSEVDASATPT